MFLELLGRTQIIDAMMPSIESLLGEEHCIDVNEDPMLLEVIKEELQALPHDSELSIKSEEIDLCLTRAELEEAAIMHTETLFDHIRPFVNNLPEPSTASFLIVEEEPAWPGLIQRLKQEMGLSPQCIKLE